MLALTHEEAVTFHVAQTINSYRDLPLILYHFQVKERDEPRPRAGVLRTREFVMKDSYSFDRDQAGLEERYALHVGAYDRIMGRTGLRFYRVESDVGMMGGHGCPRVHGALPGRRGRGGPGRGLCGQRRGRATSALRSQRTAEGGYVRGGEALTVEPAIEIGNIFKLGTRYSEPLGATYLDEQGKELPIWMGSYGIGPARIVAAAVEQFADEHGISWPKALAPVRRAPGRGRQARARPSATPPRALYETLVGGGRGRALRRPRSGPGGEVRRRRAARLPRAPDRGTDAAWSPARSRSSCDAGAWRLPACRWRRFAKLS